MTYSIEKHFLAFMTFLPIILLEYQTALQKFGKIKHTNYRVYRQQAYRANTPAMNNNDGPHRGCLLKN